jgi:spore coat polysaccharide biosynthesis predicted glycosyltransferase SpsG/SAM-dependent methyltransferase
VLQIIADGGPQLGYGHVGRCLAIAEKFGGDAVFTVDDESLIGFIVAHGGRALAANAPVVLIDRRAPTDAIEVHALRDAGQRVVLLDDSGTGRDVADLVIDPPTAAAWPPTRTPRLAGFEHVLLRHEVRDAAQAQRDNTDRPAQAQRVLLAMGGSDPTGATRPLAGALAEAGGIDITVVLGPGYRGSRPEVGTVLDRPELFVPTLAAADLFVASYGHALLEAAHLGVPAIAVVLLPEHRRHAEAFCANGTAVMLDMSDGLRPEALVGLVHELQASRARRSALADRGRQLIDGRGAERVAHAIRALASENGRQDPPVDPLEHTGPVVTRSGAAQAIDCLTCGWVHLNPVPDVDELAAMYEDSYYQEHNPGWLQKDRSEQAYWDLEHADKLSDWAELLGRDSATLLDVGCSGGLLLEFAAQRGWQTIGIEPSSEAVEEARSHGLDVRRGLYQEIAIEPRSIDVVHAKLVAEHLPDPRGFMRWAATVLRPGGILCVHVPNDFNPLQLAARDALGKGDWWVGAPFHINYFTFASLEHLMRTSGFDPVRRDATFAVEWFLLMGEDYVGNDELGALVHKRRMTLETALESLGLRRGLHDHLAAQGLGREAIVHARVRT